MERVGLSEMNDVEFGTTIGWWRFAWMATQTSQTHNLKIGLSITSTHAKQVSKSHCVLRKILWENFWRWTETSSRHTTASDGKEEEETINKVFLQEVWRFDVMYYGKFGFGKKETEAENTENAEDRYMLNWEAIWLIELCIDWWVRCWQSPLQNGSLVVAFRMQTQTRDRVPHESSRIERRKSETEYLGHIRPWVFRVSDTIVLS